MADPGSKPVTYAELLMILEHLPLLVLEKRRRLGLSVREAAKQTRESFSTISRAENGHDLRLSTVIALVEWLGRPDFPPTPTERNKP